MKQSHPFITGTIILTLTGLVSRLIGFFYRIYLSRLFGEEGMGVYQLLSPVLALTFSITAAGLQTAISKYVAGDCQGRDSRSTFRFVSVGILLSLLLSFLCMGVLMQFSEQIAADFLLEPRTASMLRIIALSIPVGAVHSCINGYFYGIKKAGLPAATQLVEQLCRIACVMLAGAFAASKNKTPTINAAVIGLVVGEFLAMLFSLAALLLRVRKMHTAPAYDSSPIAPLRAGFLLLRLSLPLSLTRLILNLLQSVEAVCLPAMLQTYGYDPVTALSVYGVLTGMALPLLFFPNALTGSISLMLLPVVSEADAAGKQEVVRRAAKRTVYSCLLLGSLCTLFFFLSGNLLGRLLFASELAGRFICSLSFLCPFLYLGTTLASILHGLGKAGGVFFVNVSSLLLRLGFVYFLLPRYGINSYLAGMLTSQLYAALLLLLLIRRSCIRPV